MVKAMHAAGIEVILDVVYNHTAEGNHLGPTLSFKGIDNAAYYRLVEDDQRYYMDYTGTGNTLNVRHPHSVQLIMDSLRYWVTEMHVDGFRFDLAATLAREFYDVDKLSTFFEMVQQDPVVSQVKLIAEPWDIGPGGYQVGGFPPQWTEWNGAYRDTVRDFWRGEPSLGEFASRLSGSSDLYEHSGRRPFASINFVTAHDGFTLRDLVSYNEKHNEANGEDNNDGESHNRSWNHGVEGPTDDPEILEARAREQRNFIATLLLSQGVPMLLHGDELSRTQDGNNNTYAQDSEISWVHWDDADKPLIEFTAAVAKLRADHPTFHRKRFFTGSTVRTGDGERLNDIVWLDLDGEPMEDGDWEGGKAIGMYLNGNGIAGKDARGGTITDDHFLLYFNADGPATVTLPAEEYAAAWDVVIDTGGNADADPTLEAGGDVRPRHAQPRRAPRALRARGQPGPLGGGITRGPLGYGPHVTDAHPPARPERRTPHSTYRLQVSPDFTLYDAAQVLPYLHDLGVDWVYLSPLLASEPGSTHGYDVVAFDHVDPERGGEEGLAALSAEARRLGMGVLVDIVPNHVGVATPSEDPWWWDVLKLGRESEHASAFDVDWAAGDGRIVIPVIGDDDEGAIRIAVEEGRGPLPRPALPARSRHVHAGGAALRAGQLARGRRGPQLPPLLRRQHPRRRARRGPRGLRRDPRRDQAVVRRGPRRRAAGRPPRRPARPQALPRRPRRPHRRRLRARREDPRARRAPARRLGHRRHHRLRRPRAHRPGAHRPRRRGAADRARGPAPRHDRGLGADGPRQQARRRRRHPALRGPAHHPRGRARPGVAGGERGRARLRPTRGISAHGDPSSVPAHSAERPSITAPNPHV